jgi:hypothetical protein
VAAVAVRALAVAVRAVAVLALALGRAPVQAPGRKMARAAARAKYRRSQ